MTGVRRTPRRATAVAGFCAVLVTACAPVPTPTASSEVDAGWDERGPITFAQGTDPSGVWSEILDRWNATHPNEQVTMIELSAEADQQRSEMAKRGQAKSGEYSVMAVDVVWTDEFASKGWLQKLPSQDFSTEDLLPSAVRAGTYDGDLYAYPQSSDAALLYYRADLLQKAGLKPPKTWAELSAACDRVLPGEKGMSCYAGQYQKYEGLTCNVTEAVNSAGGEVVADDGRPGVGTEQAKAGLKWLADGFETGMIPKEALTWEEEASRQAFQKGRLLFMRNWSSAYSQANKTDGSSAVVGKFGVTRLPGQTGVGVATLGGHNLGISAFAKNKGTAADFVRWAASPDVQRVFLEEGSLAPVLEELYVDPALTKQLDFLPVLGESIRSAKPRPKSARYPEVTLAIQDATHEALKSAAGEGSTTPEKAFDDLQTKLSEILK